MLRATVRPATRPSALRSSGSRPMPLRDRVGRACETITASPSQRMRPVSARSAPASTRASSLRPAPSSPAMPTTSPARSVKLMSLQRAVAAEALDRAAAPRPAPSRRLRKVLAEIAVGHQPHELGHRHLRQQLRRHVPAVAQHRDAMADAIDLVEPMRDVDDGDAARRRAARSAQTADRLRATSAPTSARPSPGSTPTDREAPWRSPPSAAAPG